MPLLVQGICTMRKTDTLLLPYNHTHTQTHTRRFARKWNSVLKEGGEKVEGVKSGSMQKGQWKILKVKKKGVLRWKFAKDNTDHLFGVTSASVLSRWQANICVVKRTKIIHSWCDALWGFTGLKEKVKSLLITWKQTGRVEVQLHSFLTSTLDGRELGPH